MKNGIPQMIVGAVLFVVGGYLAYSFYNLNTGLISTTSWRDVILFSVISFIGLIIMIYGIKKIKGQLK